jgi:hypothetical protein
MRPTAQAATPSSRSRSTWPHSPTTLTASCGTGCRATVARVSDRSWPTSRGGAGVRSPVASLQASCRSGQVARRCHAGGAAFEAVAILRSFGCDGATIVNAVPHARRRYHPPRPRHRSSEPPRPTARLFGSHPQPIDPRRIAAVTLDEEHRDVVADEVEVALVRIELDGKARKGKSASVAARMWKGCAAAHGSIVKLDRVRSVS